MKIWSGLFSMLVAWSAVVSATPNLQGPYTPYLENVTITNGASGRRQTMIVGSPGTQQAIDLSGAPYPVAQLNHGFGANAETLRSYVELLASRGYVVIAPSRNNLQFNNQLLTDELRACLDWLEGQNGDAASRFYQSMDWSKVATAGHSQGGKLSFAVAAQDGRVKTVFGIDPVDSPIPPVVVPDAMQQLAIPFMVTGTDIANDICAPPDFNFRKYYAAGSAPKVSWTIVGGNHCAMIDGGELLCPCSQGSDPSRQKELTRRGLVAWFEYVLRGDQSMASYLWGADAQAEVTANAIQLESDLSGWAVPTATPTSTATPTPTLPAGTPTATPTPQPERLAFELRAQDYPGDAGSREVGLEMRLANTTAADADAQAYLVAEVLGSFYFAPTFSEAPAPYFEASIPAGLQTGWIELYRLPASPGSALTITWYGVLLAPQSGDVLSDVSQAEMNLGF